MNLSHRLNRWFKPRFAVIYPFGILVAIFGQTTEHSIRASVGYVIAGLLIRLWSNGYAIKNDRLTTSGPYAFVRNPLYLGTFLICIGFCILLNTGWAGLLFILALALIYYKTIRDEQGMLEAKFGEDYRNYTAKVPAMLPTLNPYPQGEKWPFSLKRLIDSKEHKPFFWVIILMIAFHLKTRLLIEHKSISPKGIFLLGLAAILILLDIIYELNKKKIHQ